MIHQITTFIFPQQKPSAQPLKTLPSKIKPSIRKHITGKSSSSDFNVVKALSATPQKGKDLVSLKCQICPN